MVLLPKTTKKNQMTPNKEVIMGHTIIIKASSIEEALEGLKEVLEEKEKEMKDEARGEEISEAKYDEFINLSCDLCRNIVDNGEFEKDVAVFRKYLLGMPLHDKRSFFSYHADLLAEFVRNICGLTSDYADIHGSKEPAKDKDKGSSPKKDVKKPNSKKKNSTKEKD